MYRSVVEQFELAEHEHRQLVEAARTADELELLAAVVRKDGPVVDSPTGPRTHPALVESRQLRLALARLIASLRLPDDTDERPQRRGSVRRPYNYGGSK